MIEEIFVLSVSLLASTLRLSTPLVFAALGGLVCERSGVVNIALEGMMLLGAFGAAVLTYFLGSPVLGMAGAIAMGICFAAIYGFFVIELKSNQIVAGTAMNLLAAGITPFLAKILFASSIASPTLPFDLRFQSAPIWVAWILVVCGWFWLRMTSSGLWVSFAGENPDALEAAGISVRRVRWSAVLLSGCLASLGGAALSTFLASSFTRNMTAGRGYMALAALIFGKWKPVPTAVACLFFGLTDAIQIRLQGVVLWGSEPVPVHFIQVIPYLVTILVLAGFVGRSEAPKALGIAGP